MYALVKTTVPDQSPGSIIAPTDTYTVPIRLGQFTRIQILKFDRDGISGLFAGHLLAPFVTEILGVFARGD